MDERSVAAMHSRHLKILASSDSMHGKTTRFKGTLSEAAQMRTRIEAKSNEEALASSGLCLRRADCVRSEGQVGFIGLRFVNRDRDTCAIEGFVAQCARGFLRQKLGAAGCWGRQKGDDSEVKRTLRWQRGRGARY